MKIQDARKKSSGIAEDFGSDLSGVTRVFSRPIIRERRISLNLSYNNVPEEPKEALSEARRMAKRVQSPFAREHLSRGVWRYVGGMSDEVSLEQSVNVDVVRNLAIAAFSETFAESNTAQDLEDFIARDYARERFAEEMGNPDSEFHVARVNGKPAGYMQLNVGTAQTENIGSESLEIQRLYLLRQYSVSILAPGSCSWRSSVRVRWARAESGSVCGSTTMRRSRSTGDGVSGVLASMISMWAMIGRQITCSPPMCRMLPFQVTPRSRKKGQLEAWF